ncbi:hypothetical protein JAAARDRAFT_35371 [Jaapia argillacea MUCL 33604]|uniref:Inosine/uridine-preferring nucleoside hydrolase domain-containing protein n=1 Tax=Jaapia argillacea MUCL 33604 TaxID=933084 RepID=A0A067Q512_9AGAM|nr:hypothetical protein JAAARDRAFT_35371 [Jaapia argillacea MUCL 33604]
MLTPRSINVFKIYEAVAKHLEQYPQERDRFPNFSSANKPFIVQGAEAPLEGSIHSAQYFHGRDGLGGITERHPDLNVNLPDQLTDHPYLRPSNRSAIDLTLELITSYPRKLTYVALGPLTNLAYLLRANVSAVRDGIGRVVCMGGALDVPGNTSPVAEFNFFADPHAVEEVLLPPEATLGLPLERFLLLPLDITTPHELPFPLYKDKVDNTFESTEAPSKAEDKPPLHHFTSSFLERAREVMLEFGKDAMELHDIVAIWCAIENPPVHSQGEGEIPRLRQGWNAVKRKFQVERTGELTRGMLVVDRREDLQSAYSPGANRAQVQAELERMHVEHARFESSAVPAQVDVEEAPHARDIEGVACIVETPGPEEIVRLLLTRVWGVRGVA